MSMVLPIASHTATPDMPASGIGLLLQQTVAAPAPTDDAPSGPTFKAMLAQANAALPAGKPVDIRTAKAAVGGDASPALSSKRPKAANEDGVFGAAVPGLLPAAATTDYATVAAVVTLTPTNVPALSAAGGTDLSAPPGTPAGDAIDAALAEDPMLAADPLLAPVTSPLAAVTSGMTVPLGKNDLPGILETDPALAAGLSPSPRSAPALAPVPPSSPNAVPATGVPSAPAVLSAPAVSAVSDSSPVVPLPANASLPTGNADGDSVAEETAASPAIAAKPPVSPSSAVAETETGDTDDIAASLLPATDPRGKTAKSPFALLTEKSAGSALTARLPESKPFTIRSNATDAIVASATAPDDTAASTSDTATATAPATTAPTGDGTSLLPAGFGTRLAETATPTGYQLVHVTVAPGQPLADQVNVRIRSAAESGLDKIHIQLHPEDLGSIEVSISVSRDKAAVVHVSANRQETLDTLQRHAQALGRALGEAGIKTDGNSLQFELKDGGSRQASSGTGGERQKQGRGTPAPKEDAADTPVATRGSDQGIYKLVATTGLNIRV